jgi:hypothetical protein
MTAVATSAVGPFDGDAVAALRDRIANEKFV